MSVETQTDTPMTKHSDDTPNPSNPNNVRKIAFSVGQLASAIGISRTRIYEAIASGELPARKWGRRTFIMASDIDRWIDTFKKLDLNA